MQAQAFPKKKHPAIAAILALVLGPLGYFYIGWRYALTAAIVFVIFVVIFSFLLFVPPWLKYVNLPVLAFMAVGICQIHNTIIDAEHPDAFAFHTIPVAVFAMTTLLPVLAAVDTAAIGIFIAVQRMIDDETGKGLLILFLATPFLTLVHLFAFSLIASGIDWLVLHFAPNAPTNIFPSSFGRSTIAR